MTSKRGRFAMAEADSSRRVRGVAGGIVTAGIALAPFMLLASGNLGVGPLARAQGQPESEVSGLANQQMLGASGIVPQDERLASPLGVTAPAGPLAIPPLALDAYQHAAVVLQIQLADCQLDWPLLAGLGKVISDHGGDLLAPDGTTMRPILGPPLDGSTGRAKIADTDNGTIDGDGTWDRAAGPMQIMPVVWSRVGADNDGDGMASPQNIYDAALSAGRYLCDDDARLSGETEQAQAVFRYHRSRLFVVSVLGWARAYAAAEPLPEAAAAASPLPVLPSPTSVLPFPVVPQQPGPLSPGPAVSPAIAAQPPVTPSPTPSPMPSPSPTPSPS
ncbi:MAG TPA: hypothetical protein VJT72_12360, partial [Pseudonocardiaceae bacterium]|nr:hypothetical protein [Pseudonocardiaceae bacterium]